MRCSILEEGIIFPATIMWHFISEQISEQIDAPFICDDIREVSGGDTHRAFKISDGKRRFFVKTNGANSIEHFTAEAEGLAHLQQAEHFRVPRVICTGCVGEHSFLVLEHVTMHSGNEQNWYQFGQHLAHLHRHHTQQMYGWQEDNFIGVTPQPNRWDKKWSHFFAEQRIGYMLQLLAERGHKLVDIDNTVNAVTRLLNGHAPESSMLHGDLWHGNTGFFKDSPVLFDPAFYYGDRETDIAMTELFSKFPSAFYAGYHDVWPLSDDYQYRKSVYQLYHILNHALLFGEHYLQSAQATLKNLDA
ncbi:fructosamine kinase family protein [Aestuariibacter salexigens]|uniref:fructosamine kinase family protein n=1 Tax=Aestuariibacter salexigens TaxID=226010 RepID=UPI001F0B6311|nr:fructosamine kinase family protein [Aestuariibacter salexigens]